MLGTVQFLEVRYPMFRRRYAFVAALALSTVATLVPTVGPRSVAAASGPSSTVLSEFDSAADWHLDSGVGALTTVTSPKTSGTGAMRVDYNFTSSTAVGIKPAGTPGDLPGLPRHLSLDVYGDNSWTVLYFEVRDETGELLRYWVGNLDFTGWKTMSMDVGSALLVSGLNGNLDKLLDLPGSFYQLVLYKNPGATKLASTVWVDRLSYDYDPVGASVDNPIFVPSVGDSHAVHVVLADTGTFTFSLVDEAGRHRNWSGQAGGGSDWSASWTGRDDSGTLMAGSVRAVLSVTRGATTTYVYPYFAGLLSRPTGASPAQRGINSFLTEIDTRNRSSAEALARQMETAYVGMAREEFEWKRVEPALNDFEWAKFDQTVELARAHGVAVLGKLAYGSPWNNTAPAGTPASAAVFYPPSNLAVFADYARAVVHRYKDRVHAWEIWNEENNPAYWKPAPNAAQYTQLLKAAYAAIKAEDPTATVVLGGLSTGPDASFLKGIHDNGGWSSFDVLAMHTYVSGPPDGSIMPLWFTNAKNTVASYGTKPIWITEFGWSSYTGSGGTSTSDQRHDLMRTYEMAAEAGIAGISWFELQNRGTNASDPSQNWGILNSDLSAKPAFGGFQCEAQSIWAGNPPTCTGPVYPDSTFTGLTTKRILDTRFGLGLAGAFTAGTPRTFHVTGNLGGSLGTVVPSTAIAVTGNLTVTAATMGGYVALGPEPTSSPGSSTINFPARDDRANGVTVPLASDGTLSAVYISARGARVHIVLDVTGYFNPGSAGDFYIAVPPTRLLDSRSGNGVPGHFLNKVPQTFPVAGRKDATGRVVVPADAEAVTGNLTLTGQTSTGFAYIGKDSTANPTSSSVNAPRHDDRANNVVVALDSTGSLSAVFVGPGGSRGDLVFDVTGYFTRSGGWTYVPVAPTRLLDSRSGNGLGGKFVSHSPRGFGVVGRAPIPSNALAVTGNLTVTNQSAAGLGFAGPSAPANPGSSTINFPIRDNRANGISLQLSPTGTLEIVYVGPAGAKCDFILDVTGYYH